MNSQITPEFCSALEHHPVGPVRLEGDAEDGPVYLVRFDDIASLQELVDRRIREKLAEADKDVATGRVEVFDAESMKRRGRERLNLNDQS